MSSVTSGIRSSVSSAWEGIKSNTSSAFNSVKSTVSSIWNGIKDAITRPIEAAKSTLTGIISSITSAFRNMHIEIPKPKLPHINVNTHTFLGVTYPTFSVSWYAKGGFFDKASMIGVGEAGKEAVLPLENKKNMKPYAQAVASLMNDMKGSNEGSITNNFNVSQLVVREEADINRIAQKLQRLQDRENRKRGITNV